MSLLLADLLMGCRHAARLTQTQAAAQLGMSMATLSLYERDMLRNPGLRHVQAFTRVYSIAADVWLRVDTGKRRGSPRYRNNHGKSDPIDKGRILV